MRSLLAVLAGIAVLLVANYDIVAKEWLRREGRPVLLELVPVDPRSLMQGDYMALNFRVARDAFGTLWVQERSDDGYLVLALDERGVGHYVRKDDGGPLAANELRLRYRIRNRQPLIATDAYFFQEGTASTYQMARFGELRVAPDGEALLVGLRDQNLEPLGPTR